MNQYIVDEDGYDDKEIQRVRQEEKSRLALKTEYSQFLKWGSLGVTAIFSYFIIRPYISPNEKQSLSTHQVLPVGLFFVGSLICIKLLEAHTIRRTRQTIERVNYRRDRRKLAFYSALSQAERTPSELGTQKIPNDARQIILEFAALSSPKK